MLIGTGDLEMVRNAGTPCRECLNGPSKKWRALGDDFRTYFHDFVASLPQIKLPAGYEPVT